MADVPRLSWRAIQVANAVGDDGILGRALDRTESRPIGALHWTGPLHWNRDSPSSAIVSLHNIPAKWFEKFWTHASHAHHSPEAQELMAPLLDRPAQRNAVVKTLRRTSVVGRLQKKIQRIGAQIQSEKRFKSRMTEKRSCSNCSHPLEVEWSTNERRARSIRHTIPVGIHIERDHTGNRDRRSPRIRGAARKRWKRLAG